MTHRERRALACEIADRARHCRDDALAVGLYGSLARGDDGPYSDIEILCVLKTPDEDYTREWTAGPWKAEVNFVGAEALFAQAATVDGEWPLTHGAYVHTRPLHDPEQLFPRLRHTVLNQPGDAFATAIRSLIVEDLYELIGKVRNARHMNEPDGLPVVAMHLALHGAFLIGLANRTPYTSGTRLFAESLRLPERPAGYDNLCRLVMAGTLGDPAQVATLCEGFWSGVERWAAARSIVLDDPRLIPF